MLPLALVAIIASTTADILKSPPVYEALLENLRKETGSAELPCEGQTTTVETVVHHGALASDKRIKDLNIPDNCLLIGIHRDGKDIIPRGNTLIRANDHVTVLTHLHEEASCREALAKLFSTNE